MRRAGSGPIGSPAAMVTDGAPLPSISTCGGRSENDVDDRRRQSLEDEPTRARIYSLRYASWQALQLLPISPTAAFMRVEVAGACAATSSLAMSSFALARQPP